MKNFDPDCRSLHTLHKKYVKNTKRKGLVAELTIHLCNLTVAVKNGLKIEPHKVYLTSRSLKHMYDKKPAIVYDQILRHLVHLIKNPQHIYQNKPGKKGDYIFVCQFADVKLLASIEAIEEEGESVLYVVTSFPTEKKYLEECTLIWSWEAASFPS